MANRAKNAAETRAGSHVLGEAALDWCAQIAEQGHFALLVNSPSWLKLQPVAVVRALCTFLPGAKDEATPGTAVTASSQKDEPASEAVARWVGGVGVRNIFEALAAANAAKKDNVIHALLAAAAERCVAMEHQHRLVGADKFQQELEREVAAAKASTEMRIRSEVAEEHRAKEQQRLAQDTEEQQRRFVELRRTLLEGLDAFQTNAQSAQSTSSIVKAGG